MRKGLILFAFAAVLLSSCGSSEERAAKNLLSEAQECYDKEKYDDSILLLDSISRAYPRQFEVRKEAQRLKLEVEENVQQKLINQIGSQIDTLRNELEQRKKEFKLELDNKYQVIGNYVYPTQTLEGNSNRSYLRFMLTENGKLRMTSVFRGAKAINHYKVKLTDKEGETAETPESRNIHTTDLGNQKVEQADFQIRDISSFMTFILNRETKNEDLKLEFIGNSTYTTVMTKADIVAASKTYTLHKLMEDIDNLNEQIYQAEMKIKFIRMSKDKKDIKHGDLCPCCTGEEPQVAE